MFVLRSCLYADRHGEHVRIRAEGELEINDRTVAIYIMNGLVYTQYVRIHNTFVTFIRH